MEQKDPTTIYKGDDFHKGRRLITLSDLEQGFAAKWDARMKFIYLDERQVIQVNVNAILNTNTNIIIYIIIVITVIIVIIDGVAYYILITIIIIIIMIFTY